MASRKNNSININKYKRKREMNIGIFIFAVVFIYLIVTIIMYASHKKISAYEVREGSIIKDYSYNGLVIRDETLVKAEDTGYINYFQNDDSKVKNGINAYAITSDKLSYDSSKVTKGTSLSPEDQTALVVKTQNFNENFSPQKFSSVYTLKNDVTNMLLSASNQTKTAQMDAVIAANGGNAQVYKTPEDGILSLDFDGYETLTADSFKASDFDRSKYKNTSREDNVYVKKGEPAYKLITSENWSVIIPLDRETASQLADVKNIKTRIDKDSETIWGNFSILQKDGKYYGKLDYDNSMIRYAQDRFLNIELIREDESGLKIPKSAVVKKDCYVIPSDYLTSGGNGSSSGVMIQKQGQDPVFQSVEVYDITENGDVYLNTGDLNEGTVLLKPNSSDTMALSKKKPVKGVYNINKGYAVFKPVRILSASDEYYIVQEGDSYGLFNYDHIVQDGNSVKENEVVFQ